MTLNLSWKTLLAGASLQTWQCQSIRTLGSFVALDLLSLLIDHSAVGWVVATRTNLHKRHTGYMGTVATIFLIVLDLISLYGITASQIGLKHCIFSFVFKQWAARLGSHFFLLLIIRKWPDHCICTWDGLKLLSISSKIHKIIIKQSCNERPSWIAINPRPWWPGSVDSVAIDARLQPSIWSKAMLELTSRNRLKDLLSH